jgi:hypothetical protein
MWEAIAIFMILAVPLFIGTALIVDAVRRAVAEQRPVSHPNYHLRNSVNPSRFRGCNREFTIQMRNGRTAF